MAQEALKPLKWLIGKWKVTEGFMKMPGKCPVFFNEQFEFQPTTCQKKLCFNSKRCTLDTGEVMHDATGFVCIKPGTTNISFAIAHNHGIVTLEEGCCSCTEGSLEVASTHVSGFSFGKKPETKGIKRQLKYYDGKLQVIVYLVTGDEPTLLFEHIRASCEKC